MLDTLRNAAGTWVAKLLLLLLVVSFAVWGISGSLISGFGSNAVITAGGTTVSPNEYRLAYDRQIKLLSQQFGTRLTREQATALGIDNQVLAQLVSGAVLDEQARKLGLGLSKDKLAELTARSGLPGSRRQVRPPAVRLCAAPDRHAAGGLSANRAQVAIRQQIVEAVSDGLKAPDTFLRAVALYRGEDRTVDYLVLPRSTVEPIEEPADDVLSSLVRRATRARYAAPEYRKIAYVKLEPEDIADVGAISDEQVQQDYDKNKSRYHRRRKRARSNSSSSRRRKRRRPRMMQFVSRRDLRQLVKAEGKTASRRRCSAPSPRTR